MTNKRIGLQNIDVLLPLQAPSLSFYCMYGKVTLNYTYILIELLKSRLMVTRPNPDCKKKKKLIVIITKNCQNRVTFNRFY